MLHSRKKGKKNTFKEYSKPVWASLYPNHLFSSDDTNSHSVSLLLLHHQPCCLKTDLATAMNMHIRRNRTGCDSQTHQKGVIYSFLHLSVEQNRAEAESTCLKNIITFMKEDLLQGCCVARCTECIYTLWSISIYCRIPLSRNDINSELNSLLFYVCQHIMASEWFSSFLSSRSFVPSSLLSTHHFLWALHFPEITCQSNVSHGTAAARFFARPLDELWNLWW